MKSIKLKDNNYWDTSGIMHGRDSLDGVISGMQSDIAVKQNTYNLVTNGSEVKVGYQVDGKDVYAKKFSKSNLVTGDKIAHGLTNFNFIKWEANHYYQGVWRQLNYPNPNGNYYLIDINSTYIEYYASVSLANLYFEITLYYTKN